MEGKIGDWKLLKKMEIKEREKNEAVTSRAKAKTKRVTSIRSGAGGAVSASGVAQRAGVCSTRNFTTSENSLTKPKATILALDTPKPSETIEGSNCESTPSCPALGAAGAQDDCSGPSTTRGLRKRTFQKPVYCGYSTDELEGS